MPTYEYLCEANGRVIEVQHKMADRLETWRELCERAGIATGGTDPEAPVTKLISAGFIGSGHPERACGASDCGSGSCVSGGCGGGPCALQ